jgi:alginate O-acetyltransferase complex protein AlgI
MALVGLWHGFGPGFILWGCYHGLLISLNAWVSQKKFRWVDTWIERVVTQIAVFGGWVFFFSTGSYSLWLKLQGMVGRFGIGTLSAVLPEIPREVIPLLLIAVMVAFSRFAEASSLAQAGGKRTYIAALAGFILALTLLLLGQPSDFSYVQF